MWKSYINGILGIVLIIVAFMDLSGPTLLWTLSIIGGVIAVLGFWGVTTSTRTVMKNI